MRRPDVGHQRVEEVTDESDVEHPGALGGHRGRELPPALVLLAQHGVGSDPDAVARDLAQRPSVHGGPSAHAEAVGPHVEQEHRQPLTRRHTWSGAGDGQTPIGLVRGRDQRLDPGEHESVPVGFGHHGQVPEVAPGIGFGVGDTDDQLTSDDPGQEEPPLIGRAPGQEGLRGQSDGGVDKRRIVRRHLEIECRLERCRSPAATPLGRERNPEKTACAGASQQPPLELLSQAGQITVVTMRRHFLGRHLLFKERANLAPEGLRLG